MGPKKVGATKRKPAPAEERETDDTVEVEGEKRRKNRGMNEKYIGAHVRIQGDVIYYIAKPLKLHTRLTTPPFCAIQVGFGKLCTPP